MREGWKLGTLGDLVEEPVSEVVDKPHEYELLTVRLHARGIVQSGKSPNQTSGGRKHYIRKPGEILVGRQNYHRRCVGRVPENLAGYVTSNAISAFVARDGVDPDFALIAMQSVQATEAAETYMSGTGQKEISVRNLLSVPFLVPPIEEQRRVVDLIGSLDDSIEAADAQLDALAGLLSSAQADIPSASEVPLGDVLTGIESGISVSASDHEGDGPQSRILKLSAVRPARFHPGECKPIPTGSLPGKVLVANGDVLMTRSNTPDRVGYVCVARDVAPNTYMPDLVWRLRFDTKKCIAGYLEHALSSPLMRERVTATAAGTSQSMKKVNKQGVSGVLLPLPGLAEQLRYVERAELIAASHSAAEDLAESLRLTRSELLGVLLSGEHEIPESYDVDTAVQLEPAA